MSDSIIWVPQVGRDHPRWIGRTIEGREYVAKPVLSHDGSEVVGYEVERVVSLDPVRFEFVCAGLTLGIALTIASAAERVGA